MLAELVPGHDRMDGLSGTWLRMCSSPLLTRKLPTGSLTWPVEGVSQLRMALAPLKQKDGLGDCTLNRLKRFPTAG